MKWQGQFKLNEDGSLPKFATMDCPRHGIYALLYEDTVIRFGESGSGFERIKTGFNHTPRFSDGRKNWSAYSFRKRYAGKTIEVRFYADKKGTMVESRSCRAVEAEVTYQFRRKYGTWPKEMTEIHIRNGMSKAEVAIVAEILKDIAH